MARKYGWTCTGALVATLIAGTPGRAAAQPAVLYLNFSDGSENVIKANVDDAAEDRSIMGSVTPYPAFTWPGVTDEAARRKLIDDVTQQVNDAFLPYHVLVTTTRPAEGPYTMVMVGGSPALFGMDAHVAGVAYMDCDNSQPANLVFAFPAPLGDNVHGLFSTIAQEAAHAFGLQHSSDPDDLMYPRVDLQQRSFIDRDSAVAMPKYCAPSTQNSHRRLLSLMGAWPGGDKPMDAPTTVSGAGTVLARPMGGCAVAPGVRRGKGGFFAPAAVILLMLAVGPCRQRRGRL